MLSMRPSCGLPPHNHTFNVLLLGYYATGKSAILSRFSRQPFEEDYRMTLTPSQSLRLFPLESNFSARLKLIDSLGSGLSKQTVSNSLPECDAILLVYDLTHQESFYRLDKWMTELQRQISSSRTVLTVLVGTHSDQPYKRKVSHEEAIHWQKKNQVDLFFQVSSKTNDNITNMFTQVAKYLAFGAKKALKMTSSADLNPEVQFQSLPKQETTRNSKVTILEKKLSFKEIECQQLWLDYEEALQRISDLENCSNKADSSNLLSSFKECETDADELECKIRALEDNLRVLEEFYTSRQEAIEESACKRIQGLSRDVQELKVEIQSLTAINKHQEQNISQLTADGNERKVKLAQLQFDCQEQTDKYNRLVGETEHLLQEMKEKICLLEEDQSITHNMFSFPSIGFLHRRFLQLAGRLQDMENQLLSKDYQIKLLIGEHSLAQDQLEAQLALLQSQNCSLHLQLEQYQEKTLFLKAELLLVREQFSLQVEQLKENMSLREKEFDFRSEEYLEIIEQKQQAIKTLTSSGHAMKGELQFVNREYQVLYRQFGERNQLLEKKESILQKIIHEKMAEINELKTFIQELGTHSKNIVKKHSRSLATDQTNNQMVLQFFSRFLNKLAEESAAFVDHLSGLSDLMARVSSKLASIEEQGHSLEINRSIMDCTEYLGLEKKLEQLQKIKNDCEGLDQVRLRECVAEMTEDYELFIQDTQKWEFTLWQTLHSNSRQKVEQFQARLHGADEETEVASQTLQELLKEMTQSIALIQEITEVGIEEYVNSYFN